MMQAAQRIHREFIEGAEDLTVKAKHQADLATTHSSAEIMKAHAQASIACSLAALTYLAVGIVKMANESEG